jgi:hypothetical protein
MPTEPTEDLASKPAHTQGRRRLLAIVILFVLCPFAVLPVGWRFYRHFIPSGTSFSPYWSFLDPIVEGPRLVSPEGRRVIRVMFNDAGAAHSGNHWTWLIVDDWIAGKRVIAEGYSRPDVRYGKAGFPSRWLDERTLSVAFAARRYDDREPRIKHVVRLP